MRVLAFILVAAGPVTDDTAFGDTFLAWLSKGDAAAIYGAFNPRMKSALPADDNATFVKSLGPIKSSQLVRTWMRGADRIWIYDLDLSAGPAFTSIARGPEGVSGWYVVPRRRPDGNLEPGPTRTTLSLPFAASQDGAWTATNARRHESNSHFAIAQQRWAVDWLIFRKNAASHRGSGEKNEDYYAFGALLLAVADGIVVALVDGHPDLPPGKETDHFNASGNFIVLDLGSGEYALYAHVSPGSFTVKLGDKVKRGQVLARLGNSGNTSEPHLHFQIQDDAKMFKARALPARFRNVELNGNRVDSALPDEGDTIAP
jgi:murein DD-endopeptidase MepM/ murein hydrolase activator NlpD